LKLLLCRSVSDRVSTIREQNHLPWGPSIALWWRVGLIMWVITLASGVDSIHAADTVRRPELAFRDPSGLIATVTTAPEFDSTNPFFQSLGSNGRSCVACHQPRDA
jgi:hypothetical protein